MKTKIIFAGLLGLATLAGWRHERSGLAAGRF